MDQFFEKLQPVWIGVISGLFGGLVTFVFGIMRIRRELEFKLDTDNSSAQNSTNAANEAGSKDCGIDFFHGILFRVEEYNLTQKLVDWYGEAHGSQDPFGPRAQNR